MKAWFLTVNILAALTSIRTAVMAQRPTEAKISIHEKNIQLKDALEKISEEGGTHITNALSPNLEFKKINVEATDKSLGSILIDLLAPYGLTYKEYANAIVIVKKPVSVRGHVVDATTREPLVGVTVRLKGSTAATATDAKGYFSINVVSLPAVVEISYIGYEMQQLKIVGPLNLEIRMTASRRSLGEVVVQARRRANTEVAVLKERQNASVVSDAISAQQIEKTASITATQALQRVTGVTITDDKYVAIRGLGDRSVVTELNGIRLSSANPDRSAAPLDLVPAALLDNITVYKTLTPDRPADATAGIVELKTKSIPDSLTVSFTAQAGYNSEVGLSGKYNGFYNSDLGYFGQRVPDKNLSKDFVALDRQYPGGLTSIQYLFFQSRNSPALAIEADRINKIEKSFDPVLTTKYQQANPNQIYTATFGNAFKIFRHQTLGVILSANYYQRYEDRYNGELNQYFPYRGLVTGSGSIFSTLYIPKSTSPDNPVFGRYLGYKEKDGFETINYGVLAGLSYRFDPRNEISAQYLSGRGAESEGQNLIGSYQNTNLTYPVYNQVNILKQSYRIFNNLNFQGEHKILGNDWSPQISYNLAYSGSFTDEPDNRFTSIVDAHQLRYLDQTGSAVGSDTYIFLQGAVHGLGPNGITAIDPNARRYRKLKEDAYNGKVDLREPFKLFGLQQELKFGFNYLKRYRRFDENLLGLPGTNLGGDIGLLQTVNGVLNELVSNKNVGLKDISTDQEVGAAGIGGFLYKSVKSPNNYNGVYNTRALYAMADVHVSDGFRVTGGVRFESTQIKSFVDTVHVYYPPVPYGEVQQSSSNTIPNPNTFYQEKLKPYYSMNMVYRYKKNMNFRLAYNTSLARPELRELTQIYEYDPAQFAVIGGNPRLINQFTRSVDFRWEWFPHPGEVLSASLFGKKIYHQLTKVFSYTSQGIYSTSPEFPVINFQNDPEIGKVYGVELEVRKDLGRISGAIKNFFIGANLLLAASEIRKNAVRLDASRIIDRLSPATSPVFEQAPYAINGYVDYDNRKSGTNATLTFNEVGERLVQVQLDGTPDIFDRPVPVLDFVFSQKLGKRFQFKGYAKNILNRPYQSVYTIAGNQGTFRGSKYVYHTYYRGSEVVLGLTFNLY